MRYDLIKDVLICIHLQKFYSIETMFLVGNVGIQLWNKSLCKNLQNKERICMGGLYTSY